MKIRSVSVENLGNIVKQMINAALEDSEQITKLHQAIYEEWYFKKIIELGDAKNKTENVEDIREISQEVLSRPSSNVTRNTSNIDNPTDDSNGIKYLPKQDLNNIKIVDHNKSDDGRDIPVMCNKSIEMNVCVENSNRICEIFENQKYIMSNDIAPSPKVIEFWNNSMQRANIRKQESDIIEHQNREQNKGKLINQVRRRLSFESWKKEKDITYRKSLKAAEEEKQRELQRKLKEIEYKKAVQETYARMLEEKEARQRVELSKQLQMIQQTNTEILRRQIDERRIINEQAFNVWKRQKDMKLKEAKLITMENASYHRLWKSVRPMALTGPRSQFDLWLDQLDNVLHKRYLRERRHLVRSFYCRPTYYGAKCYM